MQLHACQRTVAADVRAAGVAQKGPQPPKAFVPAPPSKVRDTVDRPCDNCEASCAETEATRVECRCCGARG